MNIIKKINAVWQKIGLIQRIILVSVVLTFVILGTLVIRWASRPDMRLLYAELAPEEAAEIVEKISDQGIAYELRSGGTSIYVPSRNVYQLRLDMAQEGLAVGEQGGYKIFDNSNIGVSPFVQNVNFQRALQEEIAKTIQMIDGVTSARVHIVTSDQATLTSDAGTTTASVLVRLKPGHKLSAVNVAAIMNLVSSSVEGLSVENVKVVDSQGQLLSSQSSTTLAGSNGTVQDYQERVEQSLQSKVEEMLTAVLGPGRASVKVSAVIDINSISMVTEQYEPKGVMVKQEISTSSEPGAVTSSITGETEQQLAESEDTKIEYQLGKTVTKRITMPGEVKSISVAAFVDLSVSDTNDTGAAVAKIIEVADVEEIIRNALGLKETDSLKVVDVKFHQPQDSLLIEEAENGLDLVAIAQQASLGIMAVCALIVLHMFKGKKKKNQPESEQGALAGRQNPAGLLPGQAGMSPVVLREQIASVLEQDPERVRQLFNKWIEA